MAAKKKPMPKGSAKKALLKTPPTVVEGELFNRIVGILEQARSGVVRAVNSHMVLAYWLIGREIVQEIQGGKGRAAYGEQVLRELSRKLMERYGDGFSETSLRYFRAFHLAYTNRCIAIRHPAGAELPASADRSDIQRPAGAKTSRERIQRPLGAELALPEEGRPASSESLVGFSPQLSWSHYRALMRVEKSAAREFYEREAIAGMWDTRTLERQIHSFYYERMLKSQQPQRMLASGRQTLMSQEPAIESLKNPYVLEFLKLPEVAALHETDLEKAILSYLQAFLLELGKGLPLSPDKNACVSRRTTGMWTLFSTTVS